ncbi:hypothetical protein [Pantoea anthophila]|uniref:hypothetical protein n=1 Tax=Pantoea anthophila TaxID=470931 RepID=UPI003017757E
MKYPPLYPDYREVVAPSKKRWGIALLAGNLLCVLCTLWLWPADKPVRTVEFWFWVIVFPALVIGLLFALRSMVYQVASGNRRAWRHIMQQEEAQWWQQRSAGLPITLWCLLGPGGDKPEHHLPALAQDIPPPKPVITAQCLRVLRCPQILENDISRRGTALTRHLVQTLLDTCQSQTACPPIFEALYWCGSPEEGQRFMQALSTEGWRFRQPLLPLDDIEQLDKAIDHYQRLSGDKSVRLLFAGVYCAALDDDTETAGEAGFVWCAGEQGNVVVRRAERQDRPDETAQMLTGRVEKLAQLASPPPHCFSFHRGAAEYLQSGGWPTLENIQQPFWGELQKISPFTAISMAALQSLQTGQPCGWITQDNARKYITGVISVD